MNKKRKRFGDLKKGDVFRELPDKYGRAFTFPLEKREKRIIDDVEHNAGSGGMWTYFEDDDLVEVE